MTITIIINTQTTNILTNTEDSDNHCTKYKNFTQFPSEESPLDKSPKKSAEAAHRLTFSLLKQVASKRKLQEGFCISNTSFIISGANLFFNLKTSVACTCRFLWCIVTELSFSRSSANDKLLSWYTNLNARSCMLLMRLFSSLLWNIQIKGQQLNWDVTKAFIKHLRLLRSILFTILASACNFWLAFLQRDEAWFSNESLLSIMIPKSFSSLLLF